MITSVIDYSLKLGISKWGLYLLRYDFFVNNESDKKYIDFLISTNYYKKISINGTDFIMPGDEFNKSDIKYRIYKANVEFYDQNDNFLSDFVVLIDADGKDDVVKRLNEIPYTRYRYLDFTLAKKFFNIVKGVKVLEDSISLFKVI